MKLLTILLSLFMLFKPMLPVVEYVVFYDYITNELCVNKQKVELQCNGKCYLSKQITNASDLDKQEKKANFSWSKTAVSFVQEIQHFTINPLKIETVFPLVFSKEIIYNFSLHNLLFRPPV